MRRDAVDFSAIEAGHHKLHDRLTNWARWCAPKHGKFVQPMFRGFVSAQHWEAIPSMIPVDSMDALKIEKAVSALPPKNRSALQWAYVFRTNPKKICRKLEVSMDGLAGLVRVGRQMLLRSV